MIALPVIVAVGMADRYMPALSDWYVRMAVDYLPDSATRLAPLTDDERAYYACVRSVVKEMDGERSIATFASSETATTQELGDGRRIIESEVVESVDNGNSEPIVFRCIARANEAEEWVIERVELLASDGASPSLAAWDDPLP